MPDLEPTVLIVDDTPANLDVLEAILEPLDVELLRAGSGEEALRQLLQREVAVIVLDVRMPGMDGFETADLVKRRPRTAHVPIIFLTAYGDDRDEALAGYEVGAVDFIGKPVEPSVLRSKVATFVELHRQRAEVARQARLLREVEVRAAERELERVRETGARQYQELAEAMPAMVFALDRCGVVTYANNRWTEFTGGPQLRTFADPASREWDLVHPADRVAAQRAWEAALADPGALHAGELELEVRLRPRAGGWVWHLLRCVPLRDDDGQGWRGWVGSATQIDEARRSETTQRTLAEAGAVLAATLDWEQGFAAVARLIVPDIADWCSIDVRDAEGEIHRVALMCDGSIEPTEVEGLGELLAPDRPGSPAARVLAGGTAPNRVLLDADGTDLAAGAEHASTIAVPLTARGVRLGSLTLARTRGSSQLGAPETTFARELANRLGVAIDAARLYRSAEERARAAEVLNAIADGVALIDDAGIVRLWNPAAGEITGVSADTIVGHRAVDVLPGWAELVERVPVRTDPEGRAQSLTLPLDLGGSDAWLSISAVGFGLGTAYAFRDLTEERAVERMKTDFVATVSHELRTPLAAIYGAAVTLQREDLDLVQETRDQLLDIVGSQAHRLAGIVDDVLTASRIDADAMSESPSLVDVEEIAIEAIEAARMRLDSEHELLLESDGGVPDVDVDAGHLKQVLTNLVDNAVKYSPEGGAVRVRLDHDERTVRVAVIDQGLGIAQGEQQRIFQKFYRIDANMSGGIGGTGLGLFIVRELVRRMHGDIGVRSNVGKGSCFTVTLPVPARVPATPLVPAEAAD